MTDPFGARKTLETSAGTVSYYSLPQLETDGVAAVSRLPYSIRILLESALRNLNGVEVQEKDVRNLAGWRANGERPEIPYMPARVILQDFTGVPAVVDLAALRSAMARMGGDPKRINPQVPVDLVIDHSVQVDVFGTPDALARNAEIEFERNRERYEFLKWGRSAFQNFRVVPPATGIVHQVNLEYLASVVHREGDLVYPDTLVGTDSHTTMINGLGVLGWGVGGIEAEAVMLGQPVYMLAPDVIGFRMTGQLPPGATATDLVLTVVQILRARGVVGKFVEFFGPGLDRLTLADRATIANMGPEYGATMGFFPVDGVTIDYLRQTGRPAERVDLVERYTKAQGLFRTADSPEPEYTGVAELDLGTVVPSLAGPSRPQDRVALSDMKSAFGKTLTRPVAEGGFGVAEAEAGKTVDVRFNGATGPMGHGSVVISAITSCTNTSNPSVMLAAGLVARKARAKGLAPRPHVKTSLAPGSRVVTRYLEASGLLPDLEALGFDVVGYGCTTCIGNSGPLPAPVAAAVRENDLVAAAVLSGNRNFTGRVHALVKASYLASPPLVVVYALAGRTDVDFEREPIGQGSDGQDVFFRDLWPTAEEVQEVVRTSVTPDMFREEYGNVFDGNETWNAIATSGGEVYDWKDDSTYVQEPPFFIDMGVEPPGFHPIEKARVLLLLGDSVTTDHISPAGSIPADGPAGKFLQGAGVGPKDFNSFGSRRGNDRVMTRGTFANIRIRNRLAPGTEGGVTTHLPTGDVVSVYEAARRYQEAGTPLIVIGGKEYGTGSSRDWAAKGTLLLGVGAVLAESYERIHRSNLVGMGVLPLEFLPGQSAASLGLTGKEHFTIEGLTDDLEPMARVTVRADEAAFEAVVRLDTPVEINYYKNGGILHTVLRNFLKTKA